MIHVITGQTATGKTKYALQLAKEQNGELINFDSRQIYKHLDIITGKDFTDPIFHKKTTLESFDIGHYLINDTPIWLYDIVNPKQNFSAFEFEKCALFIIQDILKRGKTPILVGGTYFYLKYLLYIRQEEEFEPDWTLRRELDSKSVEVLQRIVKELDEETLESMNDSDRQNPRRLMRKIELLKQGQLLQDFSQKIILGEKLGIPDLTVELKGFYYSDKEKLTQTIRNRAEERLKNGALEEVQNLLKNGFTAFDPGLQTIGYSQILQFIDKTLSETEMIEAWIHKEIQYAKRQYTFMKKDSHIDWYAL